MEHGAMYLRRMPMDWGLARDYAARDVHAEEALMQRHRQVAMLLAVAGIVGLGCGGGRRSVDEPIEDDTTPGICEVHHIPFAEEVIPVHYGYPPKRMTPFTDDELKQLHEEHAALRTVFPDSHRANGAGGCVVRPFKFAKVSYCPECRKADEEWHAKHGRVKLVDEPH